MNVYSVFRPVERVVGAIDSGWRRFWRAFVDGPLQTFFFVLIVVISGCIALLKAAMSEADRWWQALRRH